MSRHNKGWTRARSHDEAGGDVPPREEVGEPLPHEDAGEAAPPVDGVGGGDPALIDEVSPPVGTEWAWQQTWLYKVAETPERDLRGHRIALTYHALAVDLYAWIYGVDGCVKQDAIVGQTPPVNANWFNFGTWATATLNADIRNDDPPYRSDRLVPPGFYRRLTPTVLAIKSANRQRYNQLLTWYQRMVFINTTFAYAAMRDSERLEPDAEFARIERRGDDDCIIVEAPGWPDWMDDAQAEVKPRAGQPGLEVERHLKPVAMAMEYYRRARSVTKCLDALPHAQERRDGALPTATQLYFEYLRARLIFFADLIITAVEQDVVDPGVQRVLNNVPVAAGDYVSNHLARVAQRVFGVPRQLAGLRIPVKLQPAEEVFEEMWVRLLTRELLVLALPAETLRLGRDVPPLAAGEPFFPEELFDLRSLPPFDRARVPDRARHGYVADDGQHRADNFDLFRTVQAFDRSQGDGCGTGARDWRRIEQRLNWAATLIRTRIQDASLFWPPFRNEDVERIVAGELPLHSGNPTDFDVLGPLESFAYLSGHTDPQDVPLRRREM